MSAKVVAKVSFKGTLRRVVITDSNIEWDGFLDQLSEILNSVAGTLCFEVAPAVGDDSASTFGSEGGVTYDTFLVVGEPVREEEGEGTKELGTEGEVASKVEVERTAKKAAEVADQAAVHTVTTLEQAAGPDTAPAAAQEHPDTVKEQHSAEEKGKAHEAPNRSSSARERPSASEDSADSKNPIEQFVESVEPLFEALRAHVEANHEVYEKIEKEMGVAGAEMGRTPTLKPAPEPATTLPRTGTSTTIVFIANLFIVHIHRSHSKWQPSEASHIVCSCVGRRRTFCPARAPSTATSPSIISTHGSTTFNEASESGAPEGHPRPYFCYCPWMAQMGISVYVNSSTSR
ncbi:hypothetical protein BDK51DRAFT_45427 [Blyttiomyces helicus]|uniref:PB1 domain-containing protein n=1 Tax=Blyttiomyces helicus TaxID=388810 RepID=A0A4P9W5P1_9FUNG|nr:hypothetical protein BDK51DRAFT_45427 [Blyttiomyces helicus]|eukprot:RKO87584.1 hypothetical protein BDK51DRAFT_45427 [Blyttiomyces helicus]